MRVAGVLAALVAVAGQPPYNPGQWLQSADLPGMPIQITDTSDTDGQFCAFQCNANAACMGYNYAPHGCASTPSCPYASGCCWLKANATSSAITTAVPSCASSFIMRFDPASFPPAPPPATPPAGAKNVLYILIDDFRPDVAPYGADWMITPGINALAAAGVAFNRAYTNIAVCSPSRMSFLTGKYPHHTRTWNFINHFRQANCQETPGAKHDGTPYAWRQVLDGGAAQCCSFCTADTGCAGWTLAAGSGNCTLFAASNGLKHGTSGHVSGWSGTTTSRSWTSLPQHFKQAGYLTMGTGKIFHTEEGGEGPAPWDGPGTGMPPLQDPPSWSPGNTSMSNVNALAPMRNCDSIGGSTDTCSVAGASKAGDVPAGTFTFEDRTVAEDGILKMRTAAANKASSGQPFFLAVGFRKPHLPFRHPAPWDDDYPSPSDIPLATYKVLDASQPPIAYHETSLATNPYVPKPDIESGTLRRDYYAAISWMDSQLSRVVQELHDLGLANDTLIVLHSDHGWSLGEHAEWEKFTLFEHGTRVPLIVSAPWIEGSAGQRVDAIAELVDVFPTMASLAGVPVPASYELDGSDLSPFIGATAGAAVGAANGTYALSVFPRCPANTVNSSLFWQNNDCDFTERSEFPFFGISVRVPDWRYTEWRHWNGTVQAPTRAKAPVAIELYDHRGDNGTSFDGPYEVKNLAGDPAYASQQAQLAALLQQAYPTWA